MTPACADGALLVATARVCLHSPPRTHTAQKTALYRCVEMGFFEVVQVLLDHKADPNIQETEVRLCAGGRVWGLNALDSIAIAITISITITNTVSITIAITLTLTMSLPLEHV